MNEETEVREDAERYTISVNGVEAGFTEFFDHVDGRRVFFHTEVDPAFNGRGLASVLVTGALERLRADGLRFVAVCPYVQGYLAKHPQFDDIRDEITDDILAAVPA